MQKTQNLKYDIIFYVLSKHPCSFCDTHSFSPSFLVTGRVCSLQSYVWSLMLHIFPSLVYLFGWQKKLCFPPTSEAYRHLSIHSWRSGGKEGSAWKNMQFEALWQQTHFWSYLRCNLSNLSDPLPLISCHPGEGEKVQRASQDVSACSSVDVENSSAQSGKQQSYRLVHG